MALNYRNNVLFLGEKINLVELCKKHSTPFYIYDIEGLVQRAKYFKNSISLENFFIFYAVKANPHPDILKAYAQIGLGIDVVSGGELQRGLECGFPPDRVIFSGVGKTQQELQMAVELGLRQINVESLPELERVGKIAQSSLQKKVRIALRINPDIEANTHHYISTGRKHDKFGIELEFIDEAEQLFKIYPNLELTGLSLHIGSQITDPHQFIPAFIKCRDLFLHLKKKGHALTTFDVGGGLGINYLEKNEAHDLDLIKKYSEIVQNHTPKNCTVFFEPGRILVARFGVLIGKVEYIKKTTSKKFAIINTGMHHLIRPALYQAYHQIIPIQIHPQRALEKYDVVGPICESSDVLATDRLLPELKEGEFVAIADAGAYGACMASQYNLKGLPLELT